MRLSAFFLLVGCFVGLAFYAGRLSRTSPPVVRVATDQFPFFVRNHGHLGVVLKVTSLGYTSIDAYGRDEVREVFHPWRELLSR